MSRIITTKHHPIPIPPTLYSTIDSYLPPPEPLKPDIFNPPVFLRTKPRALAPVQKRTQPASFYVVPTLPSLAAMPLAIVKNMMAHLPAEDMVFLSRTCWTLRETIHPVPLAFSTIHTSMWLEDSLRVWELLDDVPAHAAHVREVMLNFTTLGRIPRVALDDEPTGRPEYRDEEGVLLDYDPLDYVKLPEGVTFDHAVMLRAENLLVPALRRMHYLQSFGWYESIADVYAPAEEIFNVLGQHCKRLRALCLKLETKYWPSQAEVRTYCCLSCYVN